MAVIMPEIFILLPIALVFFDSHYTLAAFKISLNSRFNNLLKDSFCILIVDLQLFELFSHLLGVLTDLYLKLHYFLDLVKDLFN
jgi:hypothetical protein